MNSESKELVFTSGHRLVPTDDPHEPGLEIVSPTGEVQLSIRLLPTGAEVRVMATRLEFNATEKLTLRAAHVDIQSLNGFSVQTGGMVDIQAQALRAQTVQDIEMDGRTIFLNCEQSLEAP